MTRLRRPGLETLAAIFAAGGWLLAWLAGAALLGSWWWLVLGAGVLGVAVGGGLWWYARAEAEVVQLREATGGPQRIAR